MRLSDGSTFLLSGRLLFENIDAHSFANHFTLPIIILSIFKRVQMRKQINFRHSDFNFIYQNLANRNPLENSSVCSFAFDDDTKQSQSTQFITRETFKDIFHPLQRKPTLSEIEDQEEKLARNQQRLRNTLSPRHQSTGKLGMNYMKQYLNSRLSQQKLRQASKRKTEPIEETLDNLQMKIKSMKELMLKETEKKERHDTTALSSRSKNNPKNEAVFQKKGSKERFSIASSFSKPTDHNCPNASIQNNIYYISELVKKRNHKSCKELGHLSQTLKIFRYLDDLSVFENFKKKPAKLSLKRDPRYEGKKTVVFDLDETLIHCTEAPGKECDAVLTVKSKDEGPSEARINIRPYTLTLLKRLAEQFQLMVFTASESCYADAVLDYLDPENRLFQHRLYREHCSSFEEGYIKDLRIINRELCELVIVDNSAYSFCLQLGNAIPIFPYYEGRDDTEFKALEKYLNKLKSCKDVREVNQRTFRFHEYLLFEDEAEIVNKMYGGT